MKEKLNINNLYVGTIGTVVASKIRMNDFNPNDIRTKKIALLLLHEGKAHTRCYTDLETGITIFDGLKDGLTRGEYFVNTFEPIINFSDFLKLNDVIFNEQEIEGSKALKLFNNLINIQNKKVERTLAIIKPDAMNNIDKVIEMFYQNDLKIIKYQIKSLDEELINKHYSHLVEKPFFNTLKEYMMSSPVAIMVLEGEDAIEKLRRLMGPTDSTKAGKDTIRGRFGTDVTYNAIHGSDSLESAEIEINRFFKQKQKRI